MSLAGIDPNDPRPANRREYKPGSGSTLGAFSSLPYLICGNRTSGSETVDKISDVPLGDEADAIARLGARSELYAMYRRIRAVDPDGAIYCLPVTESAGVAATFKLGVSNASNANGVLRAVVNGDAYDTAITDGMTQQQAATAIFNTLVAADQGRLQITCTTAIDGAGPDYKVDITAAQKGPRGDQIVGSGVNRGIRFQWIGPTQAQTYTKNALTSGTVEDDYTAGIAELEAAANKGRVYYVVTSKTATAAPSTTDNGIGELLAEVKRMKLPAVGLDVLVFFAMVGTPTQATTVATHSSMNDWTTHPLWQENNDWTTGMIASHCAAKARVFQIAYPAANLNGLIVDLPKPYLNADNPTSTEIVTALNNGYIPIGYEKGAMRMVRFITNRSLNPQGANDYRAREGHIPRCLHFGWEQFFSMLEGQAQPNADADPPEGQVAPALTTTPSSIRAVHNLFIDEMCGNKPFGRYPGPVFKPSAREQMKRNFVVTYAGGGAFDLVADWKVVEHRIKTGTEINETGAAY